MRRQFAQGCGVFIFLSLSFFSLSLAEPPAVSDTLTFTAIGADCQVSLTMLKRSGKPLVIRKARNSSAFGTPECRQVIAQYGEQTQGKHAALEGRIEQACGNGFWYYQAADPAVEDAETLERLPTVRVGLGRCKGPTCLPPFDRSSNVLFEPPPPAPCNVVSGGAELAIGESVALDEKVIGPVVFGTSVSTKSKGKLTAVSPGRTWFRALGVVDDKHACFEFNARPSDRGWTPIEVRRAWAFRLFEATGQKEVAIVNVRRGDKWTIPLEGKVLVDPKDAVVLPSVDGSCNAALRILKDGSNDAYTGIEIRTARGEHHRYIINATNADLELPCNASQTISLNFGDEKALVVPGKRLGGVEVIERTKGKIRAVKVGTGYYAAKVTDTSCVEVRVVEDAASLVDLSDHTREARISAARSTLRNAPEGPPRLLQLKVGERRNLGIVGRRVLSTNTGAVELDFKKTDTVVTAAEVGYEGFTLDDEQGRVEFFFVEVSASN